jgi:hypothetical protein
MMLTSRKRACAGLNAWNHRAVEDIVHFRTAAILVVLSFVTADVTSTHAATADEDFTVFLRRFIGDTNFRVSRARIPLPVTVVSSCEKMQADLDWNRHEFRRRFTRPLSGAQLAENGLSQQITDVSNREVRVYQYRSDADSYRFLYTFRKIAGRWVLAHFEDSSC